MNLFSLEGKVALITGGTAGIGLAIAEGFVEAGCDTVVCGRTENKAKADKVGATYMPLDVTDEDSFAAIISDIKELYGNLDILVLNAGVAGEYRLEDSTNEQYQQEFDVNVMGVLNGLRHGAKSLNKGGSIIITSSVSSFLSMENASIYSASKAAVTSLMRSAAIELASKNIRVNSVSPGPIKTKMALPDVFAEKLTLRKSLGKPKDLIGAYLLLASDAGKNINGADIVVDGGMTAGYTMQVTDWVFD
jgi:NAD(P)-dependent dehydrogenase (short-subunit alcohol dehydrogenase family)